jgi:hypothetical protein
MLHAANEQIATADKRPADPNDDLRFLELFPSRRLLIIIDGVREKAFSIIASDLS